MRGTEYLSSAPKYNLLYEAFGWTPPKYIHLPVVMRDATRKLSKRYGDPSFEDLLEMGYLRDAIVNFIALLGWSPRSEREFFTLKELEECSTSKGSTSRPPSSTWTNSPGSTPNTCASCPPRSFTRWPGRGWRRYWTPGASTLGAWPELLQARTEVLNRIPGMIGFLAEIAGIGKRPLRPQEDENHPEIAKQALEAVRPVLEGVQDWTEQGLHDAVMALHSETGLKNGQVLWPLRSPFPVWPPRRAARLRSPICWGREETLRRLNAALEKSCK